MSAKILCLGNEFIKEDSLAKKIGEEFKKEGFEIINIKDSFQLIEHLKDNGFIILDIVAHIKDVKLLEIDDLKNSKIMTAHDFDAGFFLKLLGEGKKIKIIGIPMKGNILKIKKKAENLLKSL